jgi:hypothetical protein
VGDANRPVFAVTPVQPESAFALNWRRLRILATRVAIGISFTAQQL